VAAPSAEQQADAYRAELDRLRTATVDADLAEAAPHAARRTPCDAHQARPKAIRSQRAV
jgi:hypothetical protein